MVICTNKYQTNTQQNPQIMRHYIIYAEAKSANIYQDNSETIHITAQSLRHAITLGRRLCQRLDLRFVNARYLPVAS